MNTNQPQRYAGLLGIGGAVLTFAGIATLLTNDFMAPPDEIAASAASESGRILGGSQLAVIGLVMLAAFGCVLFRRIASIAPHSALGPAAAIGFGMSAVGALAGVAAHTAAALRADEDGSIAPTSVSAMVDVGNVLIGGVGPVGLALGVAATSLAAVRFEAVVPRPLAYIGLPLSAALMVLPINWAAGPIALVWILAVGVSLSWNPESAPARDAVLAA